MDDEIAHWETLRLQTKERYEVRKKKPGLGRGTRELRRKLASNDVALAKWQARVELASGELKQQREDYALIRWTKEAARAKFPACGRSRFPGD